MEWEGDVDNSSIPILFRSSNASSDTAYGRSSVFSPRVTSITVFILNDIIGIPLASVGILANLVNIIVFTKHGFKDTINISLISLSVSDLAFLIHTLWLGLSFMPSFNKITYSWPFNFQEIALVTGSIPRNYYLRVSSLITMYLSIERCISVLKPLQVKFIFTRKLLVTYVVGVYVVNTLPFLLTVITIRMGWKFDHLRNKSFVGIDFIQGNNQFEISVGIGVFLLFFTFVTIAVCAFILVWTLYKQGQWRKTMTQMNAGQNQTGTSKEKKENLRETKRDVKNVDFSNNEKSKENNKGSSMSERDKRAAKTVTLLAVMFVLCYLPSVLFQMAILAVPEFTRQGRYRNAYNIFGNLGIRTEGVCASANIIVYFKTGTKFRNTVLDALCPFRKKISESSK